MTPDDNFEFDNAILEQQRNIEKETSINELIGPKLDINFPFYDDNIYKQKIKNLTTKYSSIRHVRGDGNCFYRAFAFSFFEYLWNHKHEILKFTEICDAYRNLIISYGLAEYILDDFLDAVLMATKVAEESNSVLFQLENIFNDETISNYIVMFFRLITSCSIKNNAEMYQNFIEGYKTVDDFCANEVEVMNRESDHIHILALTTALECCTLIEYLDRSSSTSTTTNASDAMTHHIFAAGPDEKTHPKVYLLYRPGHYDIIYPVTRAA